MPDRSSHSPLLPLGTNSSPDADLPPALRRCARNLYQQAWKKYRDVGCPYGETDEAMLVWYSLHNQSRDPSLISGKN